MFFRTFSTTLKRIFRSPAMLFSIPAILIMLQQRTQIITKGSSPDNLFIQGGYFYQIYAQTPKDYVGSQLLFNAVIIPITHCLPIIIAVMLALILRDFYNSSERDILFATNIPFGKYYLSKLLCAFTVSLLTLAVFVAAYIVIIVPKLSFTLPLGDIILRATVMTLSMGCVGILTYLALGILVTALTGKTIAGSAAIVLYSMIEMNMASIRITSGGMFWNFIYFPQMKLWQYFYMWGTPWFEDFLETSSVTAGHMWTCVGITVLLLAIALIAGYFMFGRQRVKASHRKIS